MLALALAALLAPPTQVAVLTREAALQRFRERGFDRVLADVQVEAARADATSAGASPNPTLSGSVGRSFGYDAAQCPGCSAAQVGVGLSDNAALWDLVVGKKALRAAVAQASVQAAQHNRDAALRTLTAALLQQFYAAVQAERLLAVAEGARESSARTRALLQRRFAAGASSEVELARAEVQEMEALQGRHPAAHADLGCVGAAAPLLPAAGRGRARRGRPARRPGDARARPGAGRRRRARRHGRARSGPQPRRAPRRGTRPPRARPGAAAVGKGRSLAAGASRCAAHAVASERRAPAGPHLVLDGRRAAGVGDGEGDLVMTAWASGSRLATCGLLSLVVACGSAHGQQPVRAQPPPGEAWLSPSQLESSQITVASADERDVAAEITTTGRIAFDDLRVAHVVAPVAGPGVR